MNCEHYETAIDDSVDGTIDAAAAAALRAHLEGCADCRALADDFRAIRTAARTLERHQPPARTWHRIAAAVGEADNPERRNSVAADRQAGGFAWFSWRPLAAAAAVLLMLSATWVMLQPGAQPAPAVTAGATAEPTAEGASPAFDLQSTEAEYEMAIAGLEQITTAGGMELDPMTAEILKVNLTVIDMAIDESRAALETEPSSDVAQQTLFAALGSKVALLQDTVALINEMR